MDKRTQTVLQYPLSDGAWVQLAIPAPLTDDERTKLMEIVTLLTQRDDDDPRPMEMT